MECYLASRKKKEILPFIMTQMNPEDIKISEIRQRKMNTFYHQYVESKGKKFKLLDTEENGSCQGLEGGGNSEGVVRECKLSVAR